MDDIHIFPGPEDDTILVATCLTIKAAMEEVRNRGWDFHEATEERHDPSSGWVLYLFTK